jgi:ribosomal protein S18 acetylase RimI-like enzyme
MTVRYLRKTDFDQCWNIFYKVFERHEDEPFLNAWIHYNPALSYCIEGKNGIEAFLLTKEHYGFQKHSSANANAVENCSWLDRVENSKEHHIEFIGVNPDSQGRGLGTILLHSLLDRCKRESLSITLVPSNSDPRLIQWYEKHGFRKSGLYTKDNEVVMIL